MSSRKEIIINELAVRLDQPATDVNPDAPFFDIGIDSVDAMNIFIAVQNRTQHELSPTLLFEYDTVNMIAGYIDSLDVSSRL